jgi:hypothetical protein
MGRDIQGSRLKFRLLGYGANVAYVALQSQGKIGIVGGVKRQYHLR